MLTDALSAFLQAVSANRYLAHTFSAMFGRLHACFDPNVWYQDDELRKQIENLDGCIVLAG